MGSDDDVCDLTIAANVAGDSTHLGDLEKFSSIKGPSSTYGIPAITTKRPVTDTTITAEMPGSASLAKDRSITCNTTAGTGTSGAFTQSQSAHDQRPIDFSLVKAFSCIE